MKVRFTKTGKTGDVYDGYGERLIEQGYAVAAEPEEEFPMNPPEAGEKEPDYKTEKPKARRKGE